MDLPLEWTLKAPSIVAQQEPSFIESYADVAVRTFDTGKVHQQTLKAFEGTTPTDATPTDNGLVPHSGLTVGTHTVNGILASFATMDKSLEISQRTGRR